MTQLKGVVVSQFQLAMLEGNCNHNWTEKCMPVVVISDATHLWKTSVSEADVFVHVWEEGVKRAVHIAIGQGGGAWTGKMMLVVS